MRGLEGIAHELTSWLESLRLALGAESASLWMVVAPGDRLAVALSVPAEAETLEEVPVRGHALGWVVSEGISLKASQEDIFRRRGGWVVAAPVTEPNGARVGCVSLEFAGLPRNEASRALELAGNLAGRLLGDVRAAERALSDLAKYQALYGTIQDLDRELDLQGLAAGVCRRARRVSGARAGLTASWDFSAGSGSILATDGDVARGLEGAAFDGESSFLGLALSNVVVLPRDDLTGKIKFPLYVQGVDSRAGSAIIVPMLVEDRPIGALAVEYARPRQFAEGDLERLKALAVFVAPTFRNAIQYGEIKALSLTDALTGLPNRRSTERAIASAVAVAERTGGSFAVAVVDIDHFKRFNDRHGHDAGDLVLQTVARLIRDALRPGDHAGRWGGEEFLIVLPSTSLEDAARALERIRRSVEATPVPWRGASLAVTLSAGVSAYPELIRNAASAVASADAALYKAKRRGRNAVALADARD